MTPSAERPLQVGLTGNAASGKSTVAQWWEAAGVPVIRADDLARRVVEPGSPGLAAVVDAFGSEILKMDQTPPALDRAALRARVLAHPADRSRLEAILHPRIQELRQAWVEERAEEGHGLVVSEIPLLFEAGLEGAVDRIVLIRAPREASLHRLTGERGLPLPEAEALLAAQVDPDEVAHRAHHVLQNHGSIEAFRCAAGILLDTLQEEAAALSPRSKTHP